MCAYRLGFLTGRPYLRLQLIATWIPASFRERAVGYDASCVRVSWFHPGLESIYALWAWLHADYKYVEKLNFDIFVFANMACLRNPLHAVGFPFPPIHGCVLQRLGFDHGNTLVQVKPLESKLIPHQSICITQVQNTFQNKAGQGPSLEFAEAQSHNGRNLRIIRRRLGPLLDCVRLVKVQLLQAIHDQARLEEGPQQNIERAMKVELRMSS